MDDEILEKNSKKDLVYQGLNLNRKLTTMNFEIFSQVSKINAQNKDQSYADVKLQIVERISRAIKDHNKTIKDQKEEPFHYERKIENEFLQKYIESDSDGEETSNNPDTPLRKTMRDIQYSSK